MGKFIGKRLVLRHNIHVKGAAEMVFPLLCPEQETKWIDGWTYEMIYSKTGVAELGCTFKTDFPGEGEAYWYMSKCISPEAGEYIRFLPGIMIISLSFVLREEEGQTLIEVVHRFTGLSEAGNKIIEHEIAKEYEQEMHFLEASLNHYLSYGEKLLIKLT